MTLEGKPFADGGMGCNNPVQQVLREAELVFPGERVACAVSIGTGHARTISVPDPRAGGFQRELPAQVVAAMRQIAGGVRRTRRGGLHVRAREVDVARGGVAIAVERGKVQGVPRCGERVRRRGPAGGSSAVEREAELPGSGRELSVVKYGSSLIQSDGHVGLVHAFKD